MEGDRRLLDWLSTRLRPLASAANAACLTRRSFIAVLGATAAAPSAAWVRGALDLAEPSYPIAHLSAGLFQLRYRGLIWEFEPRAFGARARVSIRQKQSELVVRLTRAEMPGTDLRVDFLMTMCAAGRDWTCRIEIPSVAFSAELPLDAWLGGAPLAGRARAAQFLAGTGELRVGAGRLLVRPAKMLTLEFQAPATMAGQVQAEGASLILTVTRRDQAADGLPAFAPGQNTTAFLLSDPIVQSKQYACKGESGIVAIRPRSCETVEGDFAGTGKGRSQRVLFIGAADLEASTDGTPEIKLSLDYAASLIEANLIAVSGEVSRIPFRVGLKGGSAQLCGGDNVPVFKAVFRPGATNAIEAALKVERLYLPLRDGNEAVVVAEGRSSILLTGSDNANTKLLIEGNDVSTIHLNGTKVQISRGTDLLNLTFQFSGFELRRRWNGQSFLRRVRRNGICEPAVISLVLPPQHVTESVTTFDGSGCPVPKDEYTSIARPSRIVFKLDQQNARQAPWRTVPLTIEALTDWSALTDHLSVTPRARAEDNLRSQLEAMGLVEDALEGNLADVLEHIGRTLRPPAFDETAFELVDKLVFSPGPKTIWEFPEQPLAGLWQLFSIRFGRNSDARMRAIWSWRLHEGVLPSPTPDSLVMRDWGLIAQTSIGALPALRRGPSENRSTGLNEELAKVPRGNVVRPKPYKYLVELDQLIELHKQRPPGEAPANPPPPETGIALNTPFDHADIAVTAFGATGRAEWKGRPPMYQPTSALDFRPPPRGEVVSVLGTALERLFFSTFLGQDETIISAETGFLLPIGFRATLLTTQKRGYVPDPKHPGSVVGVNIERRRIISRRPEKAFPALNQPDGGRDWPASSVTLLTEETPVLVDPQSVPDELYQLTVKHKLSRFSIFWPRIKINATETRDLEWKVQIERDATPMATRMIFLDGGVIGLDNIIGAVVDIYNQEALAVSASCPSWPEANTARLYGTRRRYADHSDKVDTSFDTDSWLLLARGRFLGGQQSYIMDARMNGADQPPFYPSVRRTKISVQSIDRLVGAPQGLIECMPDVAYVQNGFTGAKDDSEIFLNVISPKIAFSLVGVSDTTVGIAQPNSFVAALSRRNGVVGGSERQVSTKGLVQSMGSGSTELAFDFGNARMNKFDPKEAFNGAFVILGVNLIDLILVGVEDTLDEGPKLVEQFLYGVDKAGETTLDTVKEIARVAADYAEVAFNSGGNCAPRTETCGVLDTAIEQLDQTLASAGLSFAALYPDFYNSYKQAKSSVPPALRAVSEASKLAALSVEASKAIVAVRPFTSAVATLIENPVPQSFEKVIDEAKQWWQLLQNGLRGGLGSLLDAVAQNVFTNTLIPALESATRDELELWLGRPVAPGDLTKLLFDPSARVELAKAFAYEQIGAPLVDIANLLSDLLQGLRGHVILGRLSLERRFAAFVRQAEDAIHSRLDPKTTSKISELTQQAVLASELISAVEVTLGTFPPPTNASPDSLRDYLQRLPVRFRAAVTDELRRALAKHPDWFIASPENTVEAILSDFVGAAIEPIASAAELAVKEASDAAIARLSQYAVEADRQSQLLTNTLVTVLAGVVDIEATSRISRAATQLSGWCQGANGALASAAAFGDGLLGDSATITQRIADLIENTADVPAPTAPPQAVRAFNEARKELLLRANDLVKLIATLESARSTLRNLAATDACAAGAALVKSVDHAIIARNATVPTLLEIGRALQKMTIANSAAKRAGIPAVSDVAELVRNLLLDLTTVGKVGRSGAWTSVSTAATKLKSDLGQFTDYVTSLDTRLRSVEDAANDLRKQLASADPATLVEIVSRISANYITDERRLAATLLQTVMFSDTTLMKVEAATLPLFKETAKALATFEGSVALSARGVINKIKNDPILSYLISLAAPGDLFSSIDKLDIEVKALEAAGTAATVDDALAAVSPVIEEWQAKHIPLLELFDQLLHVVDVFFQGNIDQLIGGGIRAQADALRKQLNDAIKQFVPTTIKTGYSWQTRLGSSKFFKIDSGDADVNHLALSSQVNYDFISNTSTAEMSGSLYSFAIVLPDMATINFAPATFSGGTGRKTSFEVQVLSVLLGDYLKFLDALRAWMAPSGNGVYVEPSLGGIRVGYQFASDLIMVGNLQFMNIAIDVFADLPFGPGAARFGFNFASEERPFIIACPPYGGGGYLQMEMDARGSIDRLALSFVFGAAVAFNFSFLTGSGRVSTGLAMIKRGPGLTIQAIVEAVGEGHIACFSLSIFIRIVLQHSSEGNLDGSATYSFSFKVGFFSVRYSVTATRHISGPGGNGKSLHQLHTNTLNGKSAGRPVEEPKFTIDTSAPVKNRAWKKYRRHIALDLIDDN